MTPSVTVLQGDCLDVLRTLPDCSVHCCVTSPPYWGLRDYGCAGQIGLEATPELYTAKMVEVFREVRRVLRDDGTCWVNMGDSYATGTSTAQKAGNGAVGGWRDSGEMGRRRCDGRVRKGKDCDPKRGPAAAGQPLHHAAGLKPKDLCGMPWRVAFALQQPYETHLIKVATNRSWLAAMIDGEGCITIPEAKSPHGSGSSFPPIIQIRMCDTQALHKCVELTGKGGNLTEQLPPSYEAANQRAAYQWRINGQTVAAVLADVYPYLLIKRKQACVAWTLQKIRDSYETKRGVSIPADALLKQHECRRLVSILNQRKTVDLPSWIEEPESIVTPGWYLRQDLIWHKPNPMPESVTDRCTKAHEYLFLLSKSERYHYDAEAIKEQSVSDHDSGNGFAGRQGGAEHLPMSGGVGSKEPWKRSKPSWNGSEFHDGKNLSVHPNVGKNRTQDEQASGRRMVDNVSAARAAGAPHDSPFGDTRNKRSVWTVPSAAYSEAHFATFPPDLIKPCILAGCPVGGTVMDTFGGSGTTGMVARELGRGAILIELNPAYCELIKQRTNVTPGLGL